MSIVIKKPISILKSQNEAYLLESTYTKLRSQCPNLCLRLFHAHGEHILNGSEFSRYLNKDIKKDQAIIRNINSTTSTDKLDYADWLQIPGTHNYKEIFHYRHVLTPNQKYEANKAHKRIHLNRSTYKGNPDTSPKAPVYKVRDLHKLWQYKLIFVNPLIKKLKEA